MKNYDLENVNFDFEIRRNAFCDNLMNLYCLRSNTIKKVSKSIKKMNEYNDFLFDNSYISDYLYNDINKAIEKIMRFKKTRDIKRRTNDNDFIQLVNSEILDELSDLEKEIKANTDEIIKNLNRY